jgi:tetratricopeptide (TPR) repeat protein
MAAETIPPAYPAPSPQGNNPFIVTCCMLSRSLIIRTGDEVLQKEKETANTVYLMAVIYARQKDYPKAIEYYKKAVAMDKTKAWRGALDPEINQLIQAYDLNKSMFDE